MGRTTQEVWKWEAPDLEQHQSVTLETVWKSGDAQ